MRFLLPGAAKEEKAAVAVIPLQVELIERGPSVSPGGSQASLWSAATGDSVATDQSGDSAHSAHSTRSAGARPSAVAEVTGPAVPTMQSQASKHKQSQPPAVAGQVPPRGRGPSLNEREDVGNIGWFFGNWGLRAAKKAVKDNIDQQLQKKPLSNHRIGRMPTGN